MPWGRCLVWSGFGSACVHVLEDFGSSQGAAASEAGPLRALPAAGFLTGGRPAAVRHVGTSTAYRGVWDFVCSVECVVLQTKVMNVHSPRQLGRQVPADVLGAVS